MVKLADTLALEASAQKAWGFKSLREHQIEKGSEWNPFLFGASTKEKREAFCTLRGDLKAGNVRVPTCGQTLRPDWRSSAAAREPEVKSCREHH